jgi:hypothetical protein
MPKHEEHICRFNDGESSCLCYDEGFEAGYNKAIMKYVINETSPLQP